jgi:uncharacterized membrane protein HdeD (DUF308 family)
VDVILKTNWWLLLMRAAAALILGILTIMFRNIRLYELALLFFGYAMIDGVANIASAITAMQKRQAWGLLLAQGIVGIVAAILVVAWQGPLLSLIYVISSWGLVTGALSITSGVRRRGRGQWLLALSGIASIALGTIMVAVPLSTPAAVALWLGIYAFVFGALLIAMALRLRRMVESPRLQSRPAA